MSPEVEMIPDADGSRLSKAAIAFGAALTLSGLLWDVAHLRAMQLGLRERVVVFGGLLVVAVGFALGRPMGRPLAARILAWASPKRSGQFFEEVRRSPGWYPRLGLWFGFTSGLAESARLALGGGSPWLQELWLAPVTYGVLYVLLGLAFVALASLGETRRALRAALFVFVALGFASWIFMLVPRLHMLAAWILALGLASPVSAFLVDRAAAVGSVVRRSEWGIALTVLAIAGGSLGWGQLHERSVRRSLSTPPAGARSVLLIVLDTVRAKSLSLFGYERQTTPSLEQWATAGVTFESAFSTAPWTLPSHAGIFTGRWAHELSADWSVSLDDTYPTLAEVLTAQGYATAGFVANLAYVNRGTGLARGFTHYEDFELGFWQAILSTSLGRKLVTDNWLRNTLGRHELVNRKSATHVNDRFLKWLDDQDDRPFFAFINYFDAHEPYMPPQPYRDLFRQNIREPRGPYSHAPNQADRSDWWEMSSDEVADERALYDAAIAYIDHEIGDLLRTLQTRGLLDDAVVVVTADHGEHFGEQGLFMHGNNLYLPQINVPLLILAPEAPAATRVTETVSLRDLPNTMLDLAGLHVESRFPGASLARFWNHSDLPRVNPDTMFFSLTGGFGPEQTPLSKGDMWSVIADPLQYILNGDGTEEIYDYRRDPSEEIDLGPLEEGRSSRDAFRAITSARRPGPR